MAVGIDIEYSVTRLVLANLRNEALAKMELPTPSANSVADLVSFVAKTVEAFVHRHVASGDGPVGVGVAVPAFIVRTKENVFETLSRSLSQRLSLTVRVDNTIRAYTLYKMRQGVAPASFAMVTIRSGVGFGLSIGSELLQGERNLAGELSHLKVATGGRSHLCRCGKRGCLETVVNQYLIYDRYRSTVLHSSAPVSKRVSQSDLRFGLADLFRRASAGETRAAAIVRESVRALAKAIAALILCTGIVEIYVAGHFGAEGGLLIPFLEEALEEHLDGRFTRRIHYEPINDEGFVIGAAMLVLRRYWPSEKAVSEL